MNESTRGSLTNNTCCALHTIVRSTLSFSHSFGTFQIIRVPVGHFHCGHQQEVGAAMWSKTPSKDKRYSAIRYYA